MFFMVLENNAIVNRGITAIFQSLFRGDEPQGAGAIDMKKAVLLSPNPGEEQIQMFHASVEDHLKVVSGVGRLRGGLRARHFVFDQFEAHCWHCMFGLHLFIHGKQAKSIVQKISAEKGGGGDSA
ncbi:hypothetical protein [uncultured Desulfosarcina sp.]|uniref:hypothetical protein n=1 Tax=uncultured Desulfosarcina sp. TaxID=218289 RepID=UPI0029C61175|nr:hypothetical protein [uncultured Desulfosarcina sp.]